MKLEEFINTFSHNNEVVIENKHNKALWLNWKGIEPDGDEGKYSDCVDMDWMFLHTDISDIDVICIKNVYMSGPYQAITIKIDTDRESCDIVPEKVTRKNSPLWLFEKVHNTKCNYNVADEKY